MKSWSDFTSQSDIFFEVLPQFNDKDNLENKFGFKITTKPADGEYSFEFENVDGELGDVAVTGSETYKNYNDTVLGFKFSNNPAVEFSAKVNDKTLPIEGASLSVKLNAKNTEEWAALGFDYKNEQVNLKLRGQVPLPSAVFELEGAESVRTGAERASLGLEAVFQPVAEKDYYVGIISDLKLPQDNEKVRYDVKALVANKSDDFEAGVYARKKLDVKNNAEEETLKFGAFASTKKDDITLFAHSSYEPLKKDEAYKGVFVETGAAFSVDDSTNYLVGLKILPQTVAAVGLEKELNPSASFSFGFAYILNATNSTSPRSAFNFGIDLEH